MNNLYNKIKFPAAFFMGLVITFTACSKKSDDNSSITTAGIAVLHAAPGLPAIDFYLQGSKINKLIPISYTDTITYRYAYPADYPVVIKKYLSAITYITDTITLASGKNYTLCVTGTPDAVKPLILEDDLTAPASGKSKVRFVNLSPDAPALDVKFNNETKYTNQAYKSSTAFSSIDTATYTVSLLATGSSTTLSQQALKFESGKIYTVYAKGLQSTAVDSLKLSVGVMGNK
ncbi:DUF4397 domain-containing protein (plasmid) [Pedobacter sp. BS3]|uniref:DUF4397 domain-containing protein n=1 Tax=Pedobacter sp. BS3 TaxID=2567937 RepID=UPI0011ED678E|nr:DUF4397 domain-containing protein [Pedobacter sp. BS3]TZF86047.1 DUF4397 domain-containing protein [Pedobacter sp. BS3]